MSAMKGELTVARRLLDSLQDSYGGFIDDFVLDALYANRPVMTQLTPAHVWQAQMSLCPRQSPRLFVSGPEAARESASDLCSQCLAEAGSPSREQLSADEQFIEEVSELE